MAISKVVYSGQTLIDLTGDTVSAETLAKNATAHDKAGNLIVGQLEPGGGDSGEYNATSIDNGDGTQTLEITTDGSGGGSGAASGDYAFLSKEVIVPEDVTDGTVVWITVDEMLNNGIIHTNGNDPYAEWNNMVVRVCARDGAVNKAATSIVEWKGYFPPIKGTSTSMKWKDYSQINTNGNTVQATSAYNVRSAEINHIGVTSTGVLTNVDAARIIGAGTYDVGIVVWGRK